ncbi:Abhydrolase 3 domain containing protein [Pyrenophora tritici-repentis]|nr:Abhydrolase 3 domain containing protein [Pyrenophora tritici-repentis]
MAHFSPADDVIFVSPEYRLAPEHPAPVGVIDMYLGLVYLVSHAKEFGIDSARIVLYECSGGAGIAASACLAARELNGHKVAALLLNIPMLDVRALAEAKSKVHISFDGWTTKGGKRGFFSVVAHYANSKGAIVDLPIALPQLVGAYTSEAIADAITKILQSFSINRSKLGYFVLDNAYNNDTAVNKLAAMYYFSASDRRLRCACYILNLVG